jgi:hypothetical protein
MNKQKIFFITIIFFGVFGLAKSSQAACSWNGNAGIAASCSSADVSSCLTDASSKTGMVAISMPVCSDTAWGSQLVINMVSSYAAVTSLTISGAGSCTLDGDGRPISCPTNITTHGLSIIGKDGKAFRITNFLLKSTIDSEAIRINGDSKNWRIDHMRFETITTGRVSNIGHDLNGLGRPTFGVMDHNYAYHCTGHFAHVRALGTTGGNSVMAQGTFLGTVNSVYIEDNTFDAGTDIENRSECITDSEVGGSFVVRHNIANNAIVCMHDVAGDGRGTLSWEVYDNAFTNNYSYGSRDIGIRSGNGVMFNNTFITTNPNPYYTLANDTTSPIEITHYTICDNTHSSPNNFFCDGSSGHKFCLGTQTWATPCSTDADCANEIGACKEFNTVGGNGRPCRDQVGVDNNLQPTPALFWNNKRNGIYYNPVVYDSVSIRPGCNQTTGTFVQSYIRSGYEYCSNASDVMPPSCNGITTTYTPYTYPHPLQGVADTTPPAAPSGLGVE